MALIYEELDAALVKVLRKEIEYLKQHPKRRHLKLRTFNPTNPQKCFLGQGFKQYMTHFIDHEGTRDAKEYREEVGTVIARKSGKPETILEIWGDQHWEAYRKMVQSVVNYIEDKRKTFPKLIIDHRICQL